MRHRDLKVVMKTLLWYLIAGTRGGPTRGRILHALSTTPRNANELAKNLHLDYKTIRHHLNILVKNNCIYPIEKDAYGTVYFLTDELTDHLDLFNEIYHQQTTGGTHP